MAHLISGRIVLQYISNWKAEILIISLFDNLRYSQLEYKRRYMIRLAVVRNLAIDTLVSLDLI